MAHAIHFPGWPRRTGEAGVGFGAGTEQETAAGTTRRGRVFRYGVTGGAILTVASVAAVYAFNRGGDSDDAERPGAAGPVPAFAPSNRTPSPLESSVAATTSPTPAGGEAGEYVGDVAVPDVSCKPKVTRVDGTHLRIEPQVTNSAGLKPGRFVTAAFTIDTAKSPSEIVGEVFEPGFSTLTVAVRPDASIINTSVPVSLYYVPGGNLPTSKQEATTLVQEGHAAPVACGNAIAELALKEGLPPALTGGQ